MWVLDCRFCRLWAAQIQLSVVLLLFVILLGGLLVWRDFVGLLVDAGWFVYLFICCCFLVWVLGGWLCWVDWWGTT